MEFFLDPNEVHGFGDLFLRTLETCLKKSEIKLADFEYIEREHTFESKKRIDLILYFKDLVLGIEHKVSDDNLDNLGAYRTGLKECAKGKNSQLVVFSLRKFEPDDRAIYVFYDEFFPKIKENLGNYIINKVDSRWLGILQDFLTYIENQMEGVVKMNDKQKERQRLIWDLAAKNSQTLPAIEEDFGKIREETERKYRLMEPKIEKVLAKYNFIFSSLEEFECDSTHLEY